MQMIGFARLGQDAKLASTNDGTAVANMTLAFNYGKKDGDKRPTQWIDAALFGKRAETLEQYLVKGTGVVVTLDDPHVETYQARDGSTKAKLVARVSALEFAGGSADRAEKPAPTPAPAPAAGGPATGELSDDVPW